ncbi:MAG: DNA polymerase III subunit delta [Bacteroidales bacterium]|nr:DNA polymerase III subunit delta [Bacteroidales bacterium]
MAKKYEEILSDIKNNVLSPIYIITGDESYYIDELADAFEHTLLDESEKDFNQTLYYGGDISVDNILASAKQYPIMAERRLVLVREAQDMDKKDWSKFDTYFNCPVPSSIIVICYKYKKIEAAFKKKVDKIGVVFESKKLYDNAVPQWTVNYAKTIGLSIKTPVSQIIADYLGNNLGNIANELSKLKLNIKEGEEITIDKIQEHIGISKDFNVFELQKALSVRDILTANKIINYFDANPKENPIQLILPSLFSYFTKILIAAQVGEKTPQNIAQAIGISQYFANEYISAVRIYSIEKLFQIISLIREYDLKSKGLNVAPNQSNGDLLKELIFKITH